MHVKRLIAISLVVAAILIVVRLVAFPGGDDRKLVQEALTDSIKASREGRPGGVMEKISDNLKVNYQSLVSGSQIADFIRIQKPDVTVDQVDPIINGDTAEIPSPVTVKFGTQGAKTERKLDGVSLIFKREDSRVLLIFPSKQWRLAEVHIPDRAMAEFVSGLSL